MTGVGWFADIDPDADPRFPWQPVLGLDGMCFGMNVWFATEAECMDFIRREIIGRSLSEH